ncbi:hypothetical protein HK100_012725 [Physocladia obscura]|uniref:Uncharacterized protein n=1 Tax=Physocladia obscura TaxID=109957 RepID=A0AAD5XG20_9FUNG|nr:hypothetical protein HK100_012725 [Physocladia obscura]
MQRGSLAAVGLGIFRRTAGAGVSARALKPVARISVRLAHSSHEHEHEHEQKREYLRNKPTKEEWLKIAREWPHEFYAPPAGHYAPSLLKFPEHPDGSESQAHPESFFTSSIAKGLLLIATVYASISYLNTTAENGTNPFTNYIQRNTPSKKLLEKEMAESFAIQQKIADDTRILTNRPAPGIHRLYFPDVFLRHSDFLVEPGSQSPVTGINGNVVVKRRGQADY